MRIRGGSGCCGARRSSLWNRSGSRPWCSAASRPKVAPDVEGVRADEKDGNQAARPLELHRQEGNTDGDRVRRPRSRPCRGRSRRSRSARASIRKRRFLRKIQTPVPVTNIARVASMNGAPRIAPTPTSPPAMPPPKTIAMKRDHRLRQGRTDGGQDRADGTFAKLELVPEPLDAVGEQLGADQDDRERNDQQDQVHLTLPLSGPRACGPGCRPRPSAAGAMAGLR